jgi:hypothetical protein
MTEDDTFRALTRIPFFEMMKIYRSGKRPRYPKNRGNEWEVFFAQYGWNWKEFKTEWELWNGGTGTYSNAELEARK